MEQKLYIKSIPLIYLEIAEKIVEEIERRGFTSDSPEAAEGLEQSISDIIMWVMTDGGPPIIFPKDEYDKMYNTLIEEKSISFNSWDTNIQKEIT